MRVKGSMILDYVKLIKENPNRPWSKYLKPEDLELLKNPVLPSTWYPYESVVRIGMAIFKEIGNSDLELAHTFGRLAIKNRLDIYQNILVPGDPVQSLKKLAAMRKTFIDGDHETIVSEHGDNWAKYRVREPSELKDQAAVLELFCNQVRGHLEGIVEQTGGKNPTTTMELKDNGYEILVKWEKAE